MVPRDDPIVEAELHVGDFEIVVAGTWDALEHHAPVVAHVPGGTALEGREARDGLGRERREERAYVRQGIRADPDPLPIHELLRELALRPHGGERVGREKRIATQVLVVARTVEQREERQVLEPRARGERIGRGDELVNERRHVAHWRTPRRFADRCVSFTCSGPRSSGGVR